MTQQSIITRLKAVEEALSMYHNFCHKTLGYSLEEAMVNFGDKALSDLRELIKEAAGLETVTHASLGVCVRDKIPGPNITYGTTKWHPQHDHGQLLDLAIACKIVIDPLENEITYVTKSDLWLDRRKVDCQDFPALAEAVITAAAEQQLAKEKKE